MLQQKGNVPRIIQGPSDLAMLDTTVSTRGTGDAEEVRTDGKGPPIVTNSFYQEKGEGEGEGEQRGITLNPLQGDAEFCAGFHFLIGKPMPSRQ